VDVNRVTESEWSGEFAFGSRPGPTDQFAWLGADQVHSCRFEEVALSCLHILKKIRKMDKSRHVGLGKLDSARRSVFVWH
jgi:hypothetical protein